MNLLNRNNKQSSNSTVHQQKNQNSVDLLSLQLKYTLVKQFNHLKQKFIKVKEDKLNKSLKSQHLLLKDQLQSYKVTVSTFKANSSCGFYHNNHILKKQSRQTSISTHHNFNKFKSHQKYQFDQINQNRISIKTLLKMKKYKQQQQSKKLINDPFYKVQKQRQELSYKKNKRKRKLYTSTTPNGSLLNKNKTEFINSNYQEIQFIEKIKTDFEQKYIN